jgi:hypothetical protein
VYTEARTLFRDVVKDFFFNCWYLEIPSDNRIWHVEGVSAIVHKTSDWKRSRISVFEVDAVLHSFIP